MSRDPSSWLGAPLRRDAINLLCFPHAGAGTLRYREWAADLPAGVGVCPVQLPGREARIAEPGFRRVPALIDALVDALIGVLGPRFVVFGHSLGAVLAFEFVRELRRVGGPEPMLLAVSGRRSPVVHVEQARLHDRPEDELVAHLRTLGGTPEEVFAEPELLALLLRALRSDFEMLERWRYTPEPALDCPIVAWAGSEDPVAPPADVARWRELTWSSFTFHELPGDHFFLHPQRRALLRGLIEALERID